MKLEHIARLWFTMTDGVDVVGWRFDHAHLPKDFDAAAHVNGYQLYYYEHRAFLSAALLQQLMEVLVPLPEGGEPPRPEFLERMVMDVWQSLIRRHFWSHWRGEPGVVPSWLNLHANPYPLFDVDAIDRDEEGRDGHSDLIVPAFTCEQEKLQYQHQLATGKGGVAIVEDRPFVRELRERTFRSLMAPVFQ
jgi:hypothetical protein